MAIYTCHNPVKWDILAVNFGFASPRTAETNISHVIEIAKPIFVKEFVPIKTKMSSLINKNKLFSNHPHAHHATDATVQQINKSRREYQ